MILDSSDGWSFRNLVHILEPAITGNCAHALLKHISLVSCLFNFILKTTKVPHTKFGNDQVFCPRVIDDYLARALQQTDG